MSADDQGPSLEDVLCHLLARQSELEERIEAQQRLLNLHMKSANEGAMEHAAYIDAFRLLLEHLVDRNPSIAADLAASVETGELKKALGDQSAAILEGICRNIENAKENRQAGHWFAAATIH